MFINYTACQRLRFFFNTKFSLTINTLFWFLCFNDTSQFVVYLVPYLFLKKKELFHLTRIWVTIIDLQSCILTIILNW